MDVDDDQVDPPGLAVISHIASEFGVEIGLRQRIAETLDSRIAWATLMKESLQAQIQSPGLPPVSFQYAAFDALRTSDRPIEILLDRELPAPPNIKQYVRPAPKSKLQHPRSSKANFLYIRSANLVAGLPIGSSSEFSILKCPSCSKTTFSSLQGLLNHARLSHGMEWGTHEECIRACAVPDPDVNLQDGLEVGLGTSGVLPGLRSIFEMAVGPSTLESSETSRNSTLKEDRVDASVSNHLSKTLGLHQDTPALATFLGKEPVRRGIKANQQDDCVDVCTPLSAPLDKSRSRNNWRLRFSQRGNALQAQEVIEDLVSDDADRKCTEFWKVEQGRDMAEDSVLSQSLPGFITTRFHFTTRVIITDRSLFIDSCAGSAVEPPESTKNADQPFTHKWMLAIDAPSYAYNITTILQRMTVTPLSAPAAVKCAMQEINQPPYVVVGLASQPFLARIDLVFNGLNDATSSSDSIGQHFSLEHWVDLDPLRCSTAVMGQEQICDVELDKRTFLKPASSEHPLASYKPFWKLADEFLSDKLRANSEVDSNPRLAYENILTDLLPRFPLTLQDFKKKRGINPVPYKLVATRSQFFNLVEGRRKAIEWGRACALRNAYNEHIEQSRSTALPPLSTADIYCWLRDEGHLHTETNAQGTKELADTRKTTSEEPEAQWCCLCGLKRSLHAFLRDEQVRIKETPQNGALNEIMGIKCPIAAQHGSITKLRPVDIGRMATLPTSSLVQDPLEQSFPGSDLILTKRAIGVADPRLTSEIRRLIHLLDFPAFRSSSSNDSPFPLDHLGQTPGEVSVGMTPYALLAMCLQSVIRKIVLSGLDVAQREKAYALAQVNPHKATKKDFQDQEPDTSLLTPSHLLTGIRSRGADVGLGGDRTDQALLLCFSSLGAIFEPHQEETECRCQEVAVKTEQP